jgi:hypothetical protein
VATIFPTQPPEIVQEIVVVSHFGLDRVKELVEQHPTLAKAGWDWGFGDWETALGAASHMGRADIAQVLLANGARPTIFSAAMLGQLAVVQAFVNASPGIQRTLGPHSISLMAHAKAGGAAARPVLEYLNTIDGADEPPKVQPLSDEQIAAVTGTYTFGVTPADRIEITAAGRALQFGRPGRYARGLFHLGGLVFCPMGAERVRIQFVESGATTTLTVHDPDVVLTARKTKA